MNQNFAAKVGAQVDESCQDFDGCPADAGVGSGDRQSRWCQKQPVETGDGYAGIGSRPAELGPLVGREEMRFLSQGEGSQLQTAIPERRDLFALGRERQVSEDFVAECEFHPGSPWGRRAFYLRAS